MTAVIKADGCMTQICQFEIVCSANKHRCSYLDGAPHGVEGRTDSERPELVSDTLAAELAACALRGDPDAADVAAASNAAGGAPEDLSARDDARRTKERSPPSLSKPNI